MFKSGTGVALNLSPASTIPPPPANTGDIFVRFPGLLLSDFLLTFLALDPCIGANLARFRTLLSVVSLSGKSFSSSLFPFLCF